MNNMQEWVNDCIGFWGGGEYLDEIEKSFGIDYNPTDDETIDLIKMCIEHNPKRPAIANAIAVELYLLVIERAVDELGAKEEDFDYFCNGKYDTYLICKGETVYDWEGIVKIYEHAKKKKC